MHGDWAKEIIRKQQCYTGQFNMQSTITITGKNFRPWCNKPRTQVFFCNIRIAKNNQEEHSIIVPNRKEKQNYRSQNFKQTDLLSSSYLCSVESGIKLYRRKAILYGFSHPTTSHSRCSTVTITPHKRSEGST